MTTNWRRELPSLLLLTLMLAVGALFMVVGSVMAKIRPNWFVGIRTPWTISSKDSWVRTHRLGGWLFLVLGASSVVNGLTARMWAADWLVGGILAMVVVLFAYSYFVWRRDPDKVRRRGRCRATTPRRRARARTREGARRGDGGRAPSVLTSGA